MVADLKDKKVLITGASGGIGLAIAKSFAKQGALIGVHYNSDKDGALETISMVQSVGGQGALFRADLLIEAERNRLIDEFVEFFGGLDMLVNNAGGPIGNRNFLELTESDWQQTFTLNAEAPYFLSQAAFPIMKKAGGGRIINISSIAVKYGGSDSTVHYAAAKAALENMTIALAKRGAPDKILVNAIRPGVIDTKFHEKYARPDFSKRTKLIPVGRLGRPDEIADLALFLASDRGAFITGQILGVTGGE